MKTYKTIKDLFVDEYDGDGFYIGGTGIVPIGDLWEFDEESTHRMIGGEVHLYKISGKSAFGWIEVSKEILAEYFQEVEE